MQLSTKLTTVLFPAVLFLSTIVCGAMEWSYVGFGVVDGLNRFNVYVDNTSPPTPEGVHTFWQGHVFYNDQFLPDGKTYLRISIRRSINCSDRTSVTKEAVFYDGSNSVVDRYTPPAEDAVFNPVEAGSIDEAVLNFICDGGSEQ